MKYPITSRTMRGYPLILICLFLLVSCNDTTVQNPTGNRAKPTAMITDYSSIENPANWCNVYGVIHNAGLDYALNNQSADSIGVNEQLSLVSAYIDLIATNVSYSDRPAIESLCSTMLSSHWTVSQCCDSLMMTSVQKYYCEQIMSVIKDSSITTLSGMISALSTIESSILSSSMSSNFSTDSGMKSFPLMIVAIAKHSAFYHAQYWLNGEGSTEPNATGFWKKVVEDDAWGGISGAAAGFVGGAIYGFFGGSIGGPVFTIGGAAGGAIVGSLGAGVSGAVLNSLNTMKELGNHEKPPK